MHFCNFVPWQSKTTKTHNLARHPKAIPDVDKLILQRNEPLVIR